MSEKRLIDWDSFYRFITSVEMPTSYTSSEINQLRKKAGKYWDGLPKPTLPDVTGTRTLDSMTEEEIKELLAMAFSEGIRECVIEFSEERHQHYNISITDYDYNTWYVAISNGDFSAVSTEGEDTIYVHPVQVVKWFIDKGFNVFWEGK